MASIQPRVGQYVRPGPGWCQRPWCLVTQVGDDRLWGAWFIAEYPGDGPFRGYKQYVTDHNFRFCEVSDAPTNDA